MHSFIRLLRLRHWVKNSIIFAPVLFSKQFLNPLILIKAWAGFFGLCAIASLVYLINDFVDIEKDRQHPIKRERPLASGAVRPLEAMVLAVVLVGLAFLPAIILGRQFGLILVLYVINNLLYSLWLKNKVILDAMTIAVGFYLRMLAGVAVCQVIPSAWILLATFFVALFLAFGKRRAELLQLGDEAKVHRTVLGSYTKNFLDQILVILATMIILTYSLYAYSDYARLRFGTEALVYTIPFVIYGIFRYFYLIQNSSRESDPILLLTQDKPSGVCLLLWLISSVLIIYRY